MELIDQPYTFLASDDSGHLFARLDFALKRGRHIQNYKPDVLLYEYCETFFEDLRFYYESLFEMDFKKGYMDSDIYYYLEFREESKGNLPSSFSHELDGGDIILGFVLLNHYHEKFLEPEKQMEMEDLVDIIFQPEQQGDYLRLFTKADDSSNLLQRDDIKLRKKLKSILNRFEDLGWIEWLERGEILSFLIRPALGRLEVMYGKDVLNMEKNPDSETPKIEKD